MADTARILTFPVSEGRDADGLALRNAVAEFGRSVDDMLATMPDAMSALRAYANGDGRPVT